MTNLVDVKSKLFSTASIGTSAIVSGRLRLLMVIARGVILAENSGTPVYLKTGSSGGTLKYRFVTNTSDDGVIDSQLNRVIRIGGDGILFDDGMYYNNDDGGTVCVDYVTVIYA